MGLPNAGSDPGRRSPPLLLRARKQSGARGARRLLVLVHSRRFGVTPDSSVSR
jgi:hypothetical protein